MFRFSSLGFLTLAGSFLALLLQALISLTRGDLSWNSLSFADFMNKSYFDWMGTVSFLNFNTYSNYVLNMPLYLLLLCMTALFFLFSGFFEK